MFFLTGEDAGENVSPLVHAGIRVEEGASLTCNVTDFQPQVRDEQFSNCCSEQTYDQDWENVLKIDSKSQRNEKDEVEADK